MSTRRLSILFALCALLLARACGADPVFEKVSGLVSCLESRFPKGGWAIGTGFFVGPKVIATVGHQVVGASSIKVHLDGGRTLVAEPMLLGGGSDLALLRVLGDAPDVTPLEVGSAKLGDEVFTIGCPLGLGQTMTRGVISQPDRRISGTSLIQTDLAINRGNSGGPLVNRAGQLVGVIEGTLKASNGIHFAVPASKLGELMQRAGLTPPVQRDRELDALWREAAKSADPEIQRKRYEAIILRTPWQATAYYNLGLLQLHQGHYDNARQLFETASLRQPGMTQALTGLGIALYRLGRNEVSRDALLRAVSSNNADVLAQFNLGVVYARGLQDKASAEASFRRYLELAPDSPLAATTRRWLDSQPVSRN
jgi:hypothetical protein